MEVERIEVDKHCAKGEASGARAWCWKITLRRGRGPCAEIPWDVRTNRLFPAKAFGVDRAHAQTPAAQTQPKDHELSDDRVMKTAAQFETVKDRRFLPFDQLDEDEARADLDRRLLVSVLGLPGGLCEPNGAMERLRRKLSIEPRQLQYARTLASRFKQLDRGDQAWRGFVNNDAWALARLQARRRKFAPGLMNLRSAIPMLRHPFGTVLPSRNGRACSSLAQSKKILRGGMRLPLYAGAPT